MQNNEAISYTGAEAQFYIYVFRTPAVVAAGAQAQVSLVNGPYKFLWTDVGFTSSPVGIPAAGQPFQVFIQDVGRQSFFSNVPFNLLALTGVNPFLNDQPAYKLPHPYTWLEQGQYLITFTNVGTLACIPELQLIGYLLK